MRESLPVAWGLLICVWSWEGHSPSLITPPFLYTIKDWFTDPCTIVLVIIPKRRQNFLKSRDVQNPLYYTVFTIFDCIFTSFVFEERERERSCDNKSSVYDILPCNFELFVKLDWVFDIFNFDNTLMWIQHIERPWARIVDWQHLK